MLRYLNAGESHGKGIVTIVEGLPFGVRIDSRHIEDELARRRLGYGRGSRMALERDGVEVISGIRGGLTLGSPLAMLVINAEYEKWKRVMAIDDGVEEEPLTKPRPGHADLPGALKYRTGDIRNILERASARETVGRVCAGAVAKIMLAEVDIYIYSHVVAVGDACIQNAGNGIPMQEIKKADDDPMRCLQPEISSRMRAEIDRAREDGDSLGGVFEVIAYGLPAGLGSHVHWDRRLDARLAAAVMGIQAIKGVEIGDGFSVAAKRGSQAADGIYHETGRGFYRRTNHAGGLEGGMTNGEQLVIRAGMKPIPTLASPLDSIDVITKEEVKATVERSDVCAVPAAAVIAEAVIAFELAHALLLKTGGDSMHEICLRFEEMIKYQKTI